MTADESRELLFAHHDKTLQEFLKNYRDFEQNYSIYDGVLFTLMREIKYKVSGAVEWSLNHSNRYKNEGREGL